jgi:hypothetical protein
MKPPGIFDDLVKWKTYLRQCKEPEIDAITEALADISTVVQKLIMEDARRLLKKRGLLE